MAHYVISGSKLSIGILVVSIFVSVCVWFMNAFIMHLDLPEVHLNTENKCVKVVNFKNGDGYMCQDVDVILRKYKIVHVQ
jgi:hypothetical protein